MCSIIDNLSKLILEGPFYGSLFRVSIVIVFIFILIILGLIFGSFVNALVWRVYKQSEFDIISQKKPNNKKIQKLDISKYSILKGRSMCPYCKHELSATDLFSIKLAIVKR